MPFSLETLAALATIIGTIVSVLALVQSRDWLLLISLLVVCLSVVAVLYARRQRLVLDAASTVIEGHSIDALNIGSIRRRVNRTLFVQEAHHTARIEGEDLEITWKYSGYCKAKSESSIEFSINSENNTAFGRLNCSAYDLGHDPEMSHEIQPLLVGPEGLSKTVSIPFLKPLATNQPFEVMLRCSLPRCIKAGFSYYASTLSFAQDRVGRCEVRLIFVGAAPSWLRVYESTLQKPATLVKSLSPLRREPGLCEYLDIAEDRRGQSARVYLFWRDSF
jgi:hypothetical protein